MDHDRYVRQLEAQSPSWWRRALAYLGRATRLKCPLCGLKPIFIPWHNVRGLRDWFTPLDGCPHCGYAYDREPGYFLMSIWALDYGFSALLGLFVYLGFEIFGHLTTPQILLATILPVLVFSVIFARHAKAYFLAIDHYFDPHVQDPDGEGFGDDGNGNKPLEPLPKAPVFPAGGVPAPAESEAEPAHGMVVFDRPGHVPAVPHGDPLLK